MSDRGIEHTWRIYNGEKIKVQFQWEPRDLWLGAFWRETKLCLHIYICIIPCVPLHITLTTNRRIANWEREQR